MKKFVKARTSYVTEQISEIDDEILKILQEKCARGEKRVHAPVHPLRFGKIYVMLLTTVSIPQIFLLPFERKEVWYLKKIRLYKNFYELFRASLGTLNKFGGFRPQASTM